MTGLVAEHGAEAVRRALAAARTPAEARAITLAVERSLVDAEWGAWLRGVLPGYFPHAFAPHHHEFWTWVWSVRDGGGADPFIAVWARGGAKSTCAEAAVALWGARRARRYALYVCDVQARADDHVGNIAAMLESDVVRRLYPALASRRVGLYGNRAWRRNRLRTASGLTVDAIGLDVATRGVKIEEDRPDAIVLDDLDDALDGPGVIERKITALTKGILPAASAHVAVLGVQNLVHVNSIFARLANLGADPADFLARRRVSGPVPALRGFASERHVDEDGTIAHRIVSGEATWEGQSIAACQALLDEMGLLAFLSECQHHVEVPAGGLFDHVEFVRVRRDDVPALRDVVVAVDPAVTDKDDSDSQAVQVDGLGRDDKVYRLRSWERRASPLVALRQAITWGFIENASTVIVETDQGGDTWQSVYREALAGVLAEHPEWEGQRPPRFAEEKAGAGHGPKAHRASQMIPDYERGRIVHVHGHDVVEVLEPALHRFPRTKPLDLVDASYWSWYRLRRWRPATASTAAGATLPDLGR